MTDDARIAAVILAAGASRRMGRNKLLLTLDNTPLVRRAVEHAVAAGLTPVVVVVGHQAAEVRQALHDLPCDCVENPAFTGPTSSSLHRGLEHLAPDIAGAVVMLADMVHVSVEMLETVVATARTSEAPLVVSSYGEVQAPPLFFRRLLFPELLAWHGEGCGKEVVRRHRDQAVMLSWPVEWLEDVDTPEDWARVTTSRAPRAP